MQAILQRAIGPDASCLGLMKRKVDNHAYFLNSLGKLHLLGVQLDLSPLYPPVPLPVPRGTPSIGHLVSWDHSETWSVAKWNDFAPFSQVKDYFPSFTVAYMCQEVVNGEILGCLLL